MALTLLVSNNANSVLAASINATSTTLSVNTGAGGLFPAAVAGQSFFKLTIIDAATGQLNEIVHVTARNGDVFTILRGQEGTVARAWSANDIVANMLTAGTIRYLIDGITNLPVASLTQAGITQLSSATDSDAENVAATPKAVKDALANVGSVKTVNTVSPDNTGNVQLTAARVGAVTNGGGQDMQNNLVRLGWGNNSKALLQVDTTPMGALYYEGNPPTAGQVGAYSKAETDSKISAVTNTANKSGSGWFKDTATGMVFQWGFTTNSSSDAEGHAFNIPFPTNAFIVVATLGSALNNGNNVYANVVNSSTFSSKTSGNGIGFNWLAIGC